MPEEPKNRNSHPHETGGWNLAFSRTEYTAGMSSANNSAEQHEISANIGVWPIFSSKIDVEGHNSYSYVLKFLSILFLVCWIIAFSDLIGLN